MDDASLTERLHRIEQDIRDLQDKDLADIRQELRTRYMDKYQMMSEYISRKENEAYLQKASQLKREWPVIVAGVVVGICAVAGVILQAIGH